MNLLGSVPYARARAGSAGVLVPLTEISCALPRSALKEVAEDAPRVASWGTRELEVVVVAEALGLPKTTVDERAVVLVHERGSAALGLLVDSVGAVLWVAPDERLPVPQAAQIAVASAVVQTGKELHWLLEPDRFWPKGAGA
jgi:hypothetical protein